MRRYYQSLSFSLSRSLEECVDLSAQTKMIKTRREAGKGVLSIYLFSKYVSSYLFVFGHKNSISPSNNNHNYSGRPPATLPCKMSPKGRVWDWDLPSSCLNSTWFDVVDVVVLLSRAPMNFLPGCTSNEGLWSYAQILALVQNPYSPSPFPSPGIELPPEFLKV